MAQERKIVPNLYTSGGEFKLKVNPDQGPGDEYIGSFHYDIDEDKYYRVNLEDDFEQTLNRNTKTTANKRWELKPLTHIPIEKLKPISTIRKAR